MTSLYTAIMKAADHIERNPREFKFHAIDKPNGCGSPGCALGWIAYFAGGDNYMDVARNVLNLPGDQSTGEGSPHFEFYRRLKNLEGGSQKWMNSAGLCAHLLHLYAEKYHGHEKPVPRNFAQEVYARVVSGEQIPEDAHV